MPQSGFGGRGGLGGDGVSSHNSRARSLSSSFLRACIHKTHNFFRLASGIGDGEGVKAVWRTRRQRVRGSK